MKPIYLTVPTIIIAAALLTGCGQTVNSVGTNEPGGLFEHNEIQDLPRQNISEQEREDLLLLRQEESLTGDLYASFHDTHGHRMYDNIARSEDQHTGAVKALLDKYEIADPVEGTGSYTDDDLQNLLDFGLKQKYTDRVHTTGWIDDDHTLAAHYRLADMMVQPVFTEELYSMASLEAMVMETPVVSCPGDLTIGDCNSPEAILDAAQEIFNNEQAMKHHTQKTKENVLKDYSMEATYNKHIDLYQNATRG